MFEDEFCCVVEVIHPSGASRMESIIEKPAAKIYDAFWYSGILEDLHLEFNGQLLEAWKGCRHDTLSSRRHGEAVVRRGLL